MHEVAQFFGSSIEDSRPVHHYAVNSKQVIGNSLFFAIPGKRVDGHDFLEDVARHGGIGAVVSMDYEGLYYGLILIRVDDPLRALQDLARKRIEEWNPFIIGVTGSVGKTTTKEFIAMLLKKNFSVAKSPFNQNSQIGLPLSVLNARGSENVLVQEMGMSEKNNLRNLVKIAPPDIVVITKVSLCHVVNFEDIEEIAEAKAEVLSSSKTNIAIVNDQVMQFPVFQNFKGCPIFCYSLTNNKADLYLKQMGNVVEILELNSDKIVLTLPFWASHMIENFLAAAAVARKLKMTWVEIATQSKMLLPFTQRFQSVYREGIHYINDSYNANPESMKAALSSLPPPIHKTGKTIGILGEMLELGKYSLESHIEIGIYASNTIDVLLCYGSETKPMVEIFCRAKKPVFYFESLDALKKRMKEVARDGDVVLIKGANENKLWEVLEGI